jgi:hypothetical protein
MPLAINIEQQTGFTKRMTVQHKRQFILLPVLPGRHCINKLSAIGQ